MSYSSQIGDMLLNVAGDQPNSGMIVGLFLLGALAFLAWKRGYDSLGTGMVVYPTAAALCVGEWLPDVIQGIALLGVGALWGTALIKLMGNTLGEGSDIQKFFIIALCWNGVLLIAGYGTPDMVDAVGSAGQVSGIITTVTQFIFMGGIVSFIAAAGVEQIYIDIIKIPLITMGALAIYPLIMKVISLIAQLGIRGTLIGLGLTAMLGGLMAYVWKIF